MPKMHHLGQLEYVYGSRVLFIRTNEQVKNSNNKVIVYM